MTGWGLAGFGPVDKGEELWGRLANALLIKLRGWAVRLGWPGRAGPGHAGRADPECKVVFPRHLDVGDLKLKLLCEAKAVLKIGGFLMQTYSA